MLLFIKSWLNRCRLRYFRAPLCLVSHYEQSTSTMVVVKDEMGHVFQEKLAKIARNQAYIQQFSAHDAHLLGYLLGHEDTLAAIRFEKTLAN